jgi:hypothetical protein
MNTKKGITEFLIGRFLRLSKNIKGLANTSLQNLRKKK